jgi:hypothetical protein
VAQLRQEGSMNHYSPVKALIDSGATYNFISQNIVDHLHLKAVQGKASPFICTINSTRLSVHSVYW